jgi:pyrroline-5-carboxylate reductase
VFVATYAIGFIGAGNMAEALCRGLLSAKIVRPERIVASDISEPRRRLFASELGVKAVGDNVLVAREAEVVVLAVKPQHMDGVLAEIGPWLGPEKLVLSIAAGVKLARIESRAKAGCRVVRAMPNAPVLVGKGVAAVCRGTKATAEDLETASRLLRCAAEVVTVEESAMDAVTALSGSGPAYCFYLVEAMIEAAVAEGLSRSLAEKLAAQTLLGAGQLLVQSGASPAELRAKVTSPGGTTEAAIRAMEQAGVREGLIAAVRRAAARSRELSDAGG